jgi:hypothetical protein
VQLASYVAILLAIFAGMRLMRRKGAA